MPRSNAARAASRCHSRAFGASRMRRTGADFYALRRGYLTPDAPMVPSTANARLTGTPMPFHRQWTTGCCRKHLLPIGVTGVFRGHAENCVQIQWVPEPRDYPATRVVALWPSAHYGAIRGDVIYDPPRFARTILRSGRDRLLPYIRPFDGDLYAPGPDGMRAGVSLSFGRPLHRTPQGIP